MILSKNYQKGFVALFSVIIISFVLVLVATTLAFSGFFTRLNMLDSESKSRSESLADACIESARLEFALNNFTAVKTINMPPELTSPNDFCKIIDSTTIIAHSVVNNAYTYYKATVNRTISTIPIVSFEELTNYP